MCMTKSMVIALLMLLTAMLTESRAETFQIDRIWLTGSNTTLSIEWPQTPTALYTLETSTNLASWTALHTLFDGGQSSNVVYAAGLNTSEHAMFYRVIETTNRIFMTVTNTQSQCASVVLLSEPGSNHVLRTTSAFSDTDGNGLFDELSLEENWRMTNGLMAYLIATARNSPSNRSVTCNVLIPGIESNIVCYFTSSASELWPPSTNSITPECLTAAVSWNLPHLAIDSNNELTVFFPKSAVSDAGAISFSGSVVVVDPDPVAGLSTKPPPTDNLKGNDWAILSYRTEQFVVEYKRPEFGQAYDGFHVQKYRFTWEYGASWFDSVEHTVTNQVVDAPPESGFFVGDAPPGPVRVKVEAFMQNDVYGKDIRVPFKTLSGEVPRSNGAGPVLSVNPQAISVQTQQGSPAPTSFFDVWNSSYNTLVFNCGIMAGRQMGMSLSPSSTGISHHDEHRTISVSFPDSANLTPGVYRGQIGVFDHKATPSSAYVDVTLTVSERADGWVQWRTQDGGNGHWYKAAQTSPGLNWSSANALVSASGAYLVTILTSEEEAFVEALVSDARYWNHNNSGPVIGAFQPTGSPEPSGGWQWVTGQTVTYTKWLTNQPDNSGGTEDTICFFKTANGVYWNDQPSADTNIGGYVMERETAP